MGKTEGKHGQLIEGGTASRAGSLFKISPFDPRIVSRGEDDDRTDSVLFDAYRNPKARELDEAMIESMMRPLPGKAKELTGNHKPVKLRVVGPDEFEIVDGRCRRLNLQEVWRRCEAQGLKPPLMLVLAARMTDEEAASEMIEGNGGLADDMLSHALQAERFRKLLGVTEEWLRLRFRTSREAVRQWKLLAGLGERWHAVIRAGKVTPSAALEMGSGEHAENTLASLEAPDGDDEAPVKPVSTRSASGKRGKRQIKALLKAKEADLPPEFLAGARWAMGDLADDDLPGVIRETFQGADPEVVELVYEHGLVSMQRSPDRIARGVSKATGRDLGEVAVVVACRALKDQGRADKGPIGYYRKAS